MPRDYDAEIAALQAQIAAVTDAKTRFESLTPERRLAERVHDLFGLSPDPIWDAESWSDFSPTSVHAAYLLRAQTALAAFTNTNLTVVQRIIAILIAAQG